MGGLIVLIAVLGAALVVAATAAYRNHRTVEELRGFLGREEGKNEELTEQ